MAKLHLDHPDNPKITAIYGFDRAVAFFATIFEQGRCVAEYDRLQQGYRDLQGALEFLAEHGFFEPDDIQLAISFAYLAPEDFDNASTRRCAEVIEKFRRAAD